MGGLATNVKVNLRIPWNERLESSWGREMSCADR